MKKYLLKPVIENVEYEQFNRTINGGYSHKATKGVWKVCNKLKNKECKKDCKVCEYSYKNLEKIMTERSEIDVSKIGR